MENILELRRAEPKDFETAMSYINAAKAHLKEQGIDQWQNGYPDEATIHSDITHGKGFLLVQSGKPVGYLCVDFDGEPAYKHLNGKWETPEEYVVVHRMALSDQARGHGIAVKALTLVSEYARAKGIPAFRVDTDEANTKMRQILAKSGFTYRGTIWFDNSIKIAFDKSLSEIEAYLLK